MKVEQLIQQEMNRISDELIDTSIKQRQKNRLWRLWAKALGEKASECDRESDKVTVIRTIVIGVNFITCLFIIAGIIRHW